MKIAIVTALYAPDVIGGAERSIERIAHGLVANGHQVIVVCTHKDSHPRDEFLDSVHVFRLPLFNVYWPFDGLERSTPQRLLFHAIDSVNIIMAKRVGRIIEAERPDVVFSNQLVFLSACTWREVKARVPIVHMIRDYYLLCPKSTMFRGGHPCAAQCGACRLFGLPRKWMSQRVNGVISHSQRMVDVHRKAGYFAHADVLAPILSAVEPPRSIAHVDAVPRRTRFGYIGQLKPEKGLGELLRALHQVDPTRWELLIAGTGAESYVATLRRQCNPRQVTFLGFTDPQTFYGSIDAVIVPSVWNEPMSRVILEALSHGLPVIGSRRGGTPEMIRPGETGYLFDHDLPGDFVRAIEEFLDNPDLGVRMAEAGRKLVATRTDQRVAAEYVTAFQAVIDRNHGIARSEQGS